MKDLLPHSQRRSWIAPVLSVALVACSAAALAGEGHDHGESAPAAAGSASPRLSAHSDLFELVGIVDKGVMTVYLDRYATNEPITGARIEYESGANKGVAQAQADGTYSIKFDALSRPGELPFAFTVAAGAETDLLAAELDLHGPQEDAHGVQRPWTRWAAYGAAAAAALVLAAFFYRMRRGAFRRRVG
jgi:cobalt-zinc-cadmium efflux system membrane fusion protein